MIRQPYELDLARLRQRELRGGRLAAGRVEVAPANVVASAAHRRRARLPELSAAAVSVAVAGEAIAGSRRGGWSVARRIERVLVGAAMDVMSILLERRVSRAARA